MFVAMAVAAVLHTGPGFDTCLAPPVASMRAWLGSPYRAMNIYIGGSQLASDCRPQHELTSAWVATVRANGWSLIPTFVDLQPPCLTYSKKKTFTLANARSAGQSAANRAVQRLQALGLGPHNVVYDDFEHYDTTKPNCVKAAVNFVEAWTTRLHTLHYVAGMYAVQGSGLEPIAQQASPRPDAIWWAHWDGRKTIDTPELHGHFTAHRIHQYRGEHFESYNKVRMSIDNDQLDGTVVGAVKPAAAKSPYRYAAAPPYDYQLKKRDDLNERSGPTTSAPITGTYPLGATFEIACQAVGERITGDYVWDRLTDGNYVSDINTTTPGGLSFTRGIPRCDTAAPTATLDAGPPATLAASRTFTWTSSDTAPAGQPVSGVLNYDFRWHQAPWSGGFDRWRVVGAVRAKSQAVAVAPGYDVCVQVRARDRSGNVGAWSARQCIARPLDDRSLAVGSRWKRSSGRNFYLATVTSIAGNGAVAIRKGAQFVRVGVVATRCPTCGAVKMYAGSTYLGSVSLHATKRRYRALTLLPVVTFRATRVRLVTVGTAAVQLDGLLISRT